jgi:hypothetical protein
MTAPTPIRHPAAVRRSAPLFVRLRWTRSRKRALLERIERGELTPAAAYASFGLSAEELDAWRAAFPDVVREALGAAA